MMRSKPLFLVGGRVNVYNYEHEGHHKLFRQARNSPHKQSKPNNRYIIKKNTFRTVNFSFIPSKLELYSVLNNDGFESTTNISILYDMKTSWDLNGGHICNWIKSGSPRHKRPASFQNVLYKLGAYRNLHNDTGKAWAAGNKQGKSVDKPTRGEVCRPELCPSKQRPWRRWMCHVRTQDTNWNSQTGGRRQRHNTLATQAKYRRSLWHDNAIKQKTHPKGRRCSITIEILQSSVQFST